MPTCQYKFIAGEQLGELTAPIDTRASLAQFPPGTATDTPPMCDDIRKKCENTRHLRGN